MPADEIVDHILELTLLLRIPPTMPGLWPKVVMIPWCAAEP